MTSQLTFEKYSACGNDFILLDLRNSALKLSSSFISTLCRRKTGIGADGLITIDPCINSLLSFSYYNADGSKAMCGNAARSVAHYLYHKDQTYETFIQNNTALCSIGRENEAYYVILKAPTLVKKNLVLQKKPLIQGVLIDAQVPHFIAYHHDLEMIDLESLGQKLIKSSLLAPSEANINFIKLVDGKVIYRTYERGVYEETLSCTTAAAAIGWFLTKTTTIKDPLTFITRSQQLLLFTYLSKKDSPLQTESVKIKGEVSHVYQGCFSLGSYAIKNFPKEYLNDLRSSN